MLAATIRDHLKKYKDKFPDTAKIVESSLYVDDFISGQENVDKALQTSLESIEIFKEAGMSLRKWHTNSKELERFWKEIKVLVEEVNCLSDEEVVPLKFTVGLGAGQIDLSPLLRIGVEEIQKLSTPSDWHHCPGKENPADFITRGLSVKNLKKCDAWWNGPHWLHQPEENWPKIEVKGVEEKNLELRRKSEKTIQNQCILEPNVHVLDLKKYSSLNKVLRVTAWILRFLTNSRRNNIKDSSLSLSLHANEIEEAELYWIKETQREFYSSEILALKKQQPLRHDSKIRSLVPFLDSQDILRISTRLEEADLVIGEKQPILLPVKSKFTELLVMKEHITGFIANKRVQWKFIPDRAPWGGGFYERMVKTVKEPLRKILGRSLLSFEELTTLLSEIENIVNLHPLTYVSDDKDDTEPLTPAHFLYFGRKDFDYPMPFTELFDKTISKETLRRRKLYQTVLLRQLWTRWKEQYLLQL
ncbi:integrase catalytic domain-containing protein [Trichonephila clavata]|uniref:Integrase catalytic domain-containing protein n=1 Tax=Trichonephila clavata TaxID=2740835 RepID=A0A8X6IKB2_TRICU|nr:integrase catalytic domain-containing protein [Trichonephila clavata]